MKRERISADPFGFLIEVGLGLFACIAIVSMAVRMFVLPLIG